MMKMVILQQIKDEAVPLLHVLTSQYVLTLQAAVSVLRNYLVPRGYFPHPFRANTDDTTLDKLRSLVGTYRCRHMVDEYKRKGVDFSAYLYVPEYDEESGDFYHEREDHCHIS